MRKVEDLPRVSTGVAGQPRQLHLLRALQTPGWKTKPPRAIIGSKEALIVRSMTFIVIHEGPLFAEEPFAFIFLNTQPRNPEKVQSALLAIPEIISADTVFGPYDLICSVRANDRADLERVISHIQKTVPKIEGTTTTIAAMLRIKHIHTLSFMKHAQ